MEVFKFAFETVIIGLLALPWLLLMIHQVNPDLFTTHPEHGVGRLMNPIPRELRPTLIGIVAFSMAYVLGSAITPVAREFLNDRDWVGLVLPTEETIQTRVYEQMEGRSAATSLASASEIKLAHFTANSKDAIPNSKDAIPTDRHLRFLHDESSLLLKGTDACERLNRLHERLAVLRGAAFNSFVLLLVCVFSWCGAARASRVARWAGFLPSSIIVLLSLILGGADIYRPQNDDIPVMEAVTLLLGVFGVYVAARGRRCNVRVHGWTFAFALFFAVLSYGGYACTEVSYDEEVIMSYKALTSAARPTAAQPAGRSAAPSAAVE